MSVQGPLRRASQEDMRAAHLMALERDKIDCENCGCCTLRSNNLPSFAICRVNGHRCRTPPARCEEAKEEQGHQNIRLKTPNTVSSPMMKMIASSHRIIFIGLLQSPTEGNRD